LRRADSDVTVAVAAFFWFRNWGYRKLISRLVASIRSEVAATAGESVEGVEEEDTSTRTKAARKRQHFENMAESGRELTENGVGRSRRLASDKLPPRRIGFV
jgi:hypothetical protein